MLYKILDAHGGKLPPYTIAVFCNTGKEVENTYRFIYDFEINTGCPIAWVEFVYNRDAKGVKGDPKRTYQCVDYYTASRNGRPFEDLLAFSPFMPSFSRRVCTEQLKVATCTRYIKNELLHRGTINDIIGFRYDEPRRWRKALAGQGDSANCSRNMRAYPLVVNGVTQSEVTDFWSEVPWGLKMDSKYSNCDGCFMKGAKKLLDIASENPDMLDWWVDIEAKYHKALMDKDRSAHTDTRYGLGSMWTYKDVRDAAIAQSEGMVIARSGSPYGGQFMKAVSEDSDSDAGCFCGD